MEEVDIHKQCTARCKTSTTVVVMASIRLRAAMSLRKSVAVWVEVLIEGNRKELVGGNGRALGIL